MQTDYGVLFGRLYRVDRSGSGPPWPLLVWTEATATWDEIGIVGGAGPPGPAGATGATGATGPAGTSGLPCSLLILTPNPYNFVEDAAVDHGQPPDFVVLSDTQDVIAVGAM